MDINTILEYVAYAIAIASVLAPALTKISAMTENKTDDKIASIFSKSVDVLNQIVQYVSVNIVDEKAKKEVEEKKSETSK